MSSVQNLSELHQMYSEYMTPSQLSTHEKYIHADDLAVLKDFVTFTPSESNLNEYLEKANHVHTILYCEAQLEYYGIKIYSRYLTLLLQDIVNETHRVTTPIPE